VQRADIINIMAAKFPLILALGAATLGRARGSWQGSPAWDNGMSGTPFGGFPNYPADNYVHDVKKLFDGNFLTKWNPSSCCSGKWWFRLDLGNYTALPVHLFM
jgi:hypothetical protein